MILVSGTLYPAPHSSNNMIKTITIIRGKKEETHEGFHQRVKEALDQLMVQKPIRLHYTISLEKPPKISLIPFSKEKIAVISMHCEDGTLPNILEEVDGYSGSFIVTEALPIAYDKDWQDSEPTPGVCLLTLFRQKKGIGHDTFIDRWHNGHTPLTLKIHPIYHYNRNTVNEGLGDPPVLYDGIVEEHCLSRKDLLNPFRFFGKPWMAPVNMIKTYFDVKGFIDYKSIETYLTAEYHVIN